MSAYCRWTPEGQFLAEEVRMRVDHLVARFTAGAPEPGVVVEDAAGLPQPDALRAEMLLTAQLARLRAKAEALAAVPGCEEAAAMAWVCVNTGRDALESGCPEHMEQTADHLAGLFR
jgi:hypothetical protein